MHFSIVATIVLAFALKASANCYSYGWDFVDGGGPYFINTGSSDYFSFGTAFEGCQPSDSEGPITPILIDPNGNEYFCSDIATMPDGVDQVSTCNVSGNVVLKSQMFSGSWIIIIEGLDFAWMRTFEITAGQQTTITATPTVTYPITEYPSTTINTTITSTIDTTLPAVTVTVPSTTVTKTTTIFPPTVTVSSTSTSTRTRTSRFYTHTHTVMTTTTSCAIQTPVQDPTCTIYVSKASLAATSVVSPAAVKRWHMVEDSPAGRQPRGRKLAKKSADLPTTYVLETTYIATVNSTFTAPTSTEVDTVYTTSTLTVTPPPATAYSGKAVTRTTITATTPTRTRTVRVYATTWISSTYTATYTSWTSVPTSGVVCVPTPAG